MPDFQGPVVVRRPYTPRTNFFYNQTSCERLRACRPLKVNKLRSFSPSTLATFTKSWSNRKVTKPAQNLSLV